MADLTLERATDGSEHYEVLDEARNVVGHIVLSDAAPPEMPWIWSVASGHHTGRKSTHGYEATRGGGHGGFRKAGIGNDRPHTHARGRRDEEYSGSSALRRSDCIRGGRRWPEIVSSSRFGRVL